MGCEESGGEMEVGGLEKKNGYYWVSERISHDGEKEKAKTN